MNLSLLQACEVHGMKVALAGVLVCTVIISLVQVPASPMLWVNVFSVH